MRRLGLILVVLTTIACGTLAVWTSGAVRARARAGEAGQELMYFPSGELLRLSALGNELLAADLVWLRGIQYYGAHRLTDKQYPQFGHIFDVATKLDPQFINAYVFGGLVLSSEGGDVDAGLQLLKRGLANNPDNYFLAFEIGFIYHVTLRDFKHAAPYYQRASEAPDCPTWVKHFAAYAWQQSSAMGAAVSLWEEVARTAQNPTIRQLAAQHAAELRGEVTGAPLEEIVD